jgi:hypothetical protein
MKKLIIFIGLSVFANETKEILEMIDILNKKSFSYNEIISIYNPFVKKGNKKLKTKLVIAPTIPENSNNFNLEVLFQNRVRINNSWYKNGDKLDRYTIIIKNKKVYLKDGNKLIDLQRKKTLLKVRE